MNESQRYVQALLQNDEKIIKEIYQVRFPGIKSYIIKNGGDEDEALDIFQDALMYILVSQREKSADIKSFEAYLFTICKNIWKRTIKKRVINSELSTLTDDDTDLSLFILEQDRVDFYIEKFQLLSENCQSILSEYFNGQSYENILETYDYSSINTVRQRVFKCRAKLIELIKKDKNYQKLKKWGSI